VVVVVVVVVVVGQAKINDACVHKDIENLIRSDTIHSILTVSSNSHSFIFKL